MAVKTLLIDEAEFIDFRLYGILSTISDAPQFVYNVNRSFDTKFIRCTDIDVWIQDQISYYPVFEWENESDGVYYNIIKNLAYTMNSGENSGNLSLLFDVAPALINQHKEYNFLLKVTGDDSELFFKENNFIQLITELDTGSIKTIDRLIF